MTGQSAFLYRGGLLLFAVAAIAVIAAAMHPRPGPISWALSWRPLCLLGLISYGAYLWHWPVYVVVDDARTGLTGWPLFGLRVAITLAIATLSYHLLEMPIRRGRMTVRTWRVAIPATAGVLVLAIVLTTAGAERRVSANDLLGARPTRTPVLSAPEPPPDGARTIMVVGNSVGWFLGDALEKSPPQSPPVVGLNAAFPACAYPSAITGVRMEDTAESLRLETSPCDHLWEWNIGYLRPDIVLIVLATPIGNLEYHGAWTSLCTPTFDREYRRELARTRCGSWARPVPASRSRPRRTCGWRSTRIGTGRSTATTRCGVTSPGRRGRSSSTSSRTRARGASVETPSTGSSCDPTASTTPVRARRSSTPGSSTSSRPTVRRTHRD